jgi:hypothetical protein
MFFLIAAAYSFGAFLVQEKGLEYHNMFRWEVKVVDNNSGNYTWTFSMTVPNTPWS